MNIFTVPIIIKPEVRQTISGSLVEQTCLVKAPYALLQRPKLALWSLERVFWRTAMRHYHSELSNRTMILNQTHFRFAYQRVSFHRQERRWGSCSSLRNLYLSHRLIGAPSILVDYVIIHELAHLKFMNHSKEFWGTVKQVIPNPANYRRELMVYGQHWHRDYADWLLRQQRLLVELNRSQNPLRQGLPLIKLRKFKV
jgi:predicted metal-dependent hydrolase